MESFFDQVPNSQKLYLGDEVLWDTAIIPDFHKEYLGMSDKQLGTLWNNLLGCQNEVSDDIEIDWNSPRWISGNNRYLNYRGRAIKRHKMWFQDIDTIRKGVYKYSYTGWQWGITRATYSTKSVVGLSEFVNDINDKLELEHKHNHWIVTKYLDNRDNIGFHSDKTRNWVSGSCFVVVKFGEARPFQFSYEDKVIYDEKLTQGTAVIVGMEANQKVKHGVPAIEHKTGVSGSIVGRCIDDFLSWDRVKKEVEKRKNRST